ncbi:hypothetical protein Q1695_010464 [Nippostrongylus brasiliensis]|nr:hypothetical protein Q1695_010464 [Nippostrongylus brasiliensis]
MKERDDSTDDESGGYVSATKYDRGKTRENAHFCRAVLLMQPTDKTPMNTTTVTITMSDNDCGGKKEKQRENGQRKSS